MAEENTDKILTKYNEDVKRHIGVLKEDFEGQVKIIGEQYASIQETLDSHTETLNSHTEMIGLMKGDVDAMKGDINVMKEDINVMKEDMEIMKVDVSFIKSDLKKKVDYDEFAALEKRVGLPEAKANR